MNRHTKTLHPNDAQPPINRRRSQQNYKCTNCTKTFRSLFERKRCKNCEIHTEEHTRTLKSSKKLKKTKQKKKEKF